jgi:RHS repeat-associated protein
MGMMAPAQQKQMLQALTRALKGFNPHTASGLPADAQKQMDSAWGAEMNQLVRRGLNTMQQAQAEEEARYPIEVRHIVCDHLGTPLALIDASGPHQGQITWAARYGAWGDIEAEYNPYQIEQPIRFQGQQFDPETGLHYNRFRYYDLAIGGYISQDPIGLLGGFNKFLYPVNPVGWIDPWGLLGACGNGQCRDGRLAAADNAAGIPSGSAASNPPKWLVDAMNWVGEGVPKTRCEWSSYLDTQSKIFGYAGYIVSQIPLTAPSAPVFAGISAAAGTGAESLNGRPEVAVAGTVVDAATSALSGGILKDIAVDVTKTVAADSIPNKGQCK